MSLCSRAQRTATYNGEGKPPVGVRIRIVVGPVGDENAVGDRYGDYDNTQYQTKKSQDELCCIPSSLVEGPQFAFVRHQRDARKQLEGRRPRQVARQDSKHVKDQLGSGLDPGRGRLGIRLHCLVCHLKNTLKLASPASQCQECNHSSTTSSADEVASSTCYLLIEVLGGAWTHRCGADDAFANGLKICKSNSGQLRVGEPIGRRG